MTGQAERIFVPVEGRNISEDVALQIEAAILGGKIRPGERLPSERELQTLFETGRGAVREALSALRQKGIIEIRQGVKGGAFVKKIEVTEASESLALLLRQNRVSLRYLIEFRESIDRTVTTLAISRGLPEEKAALVEGTERLAEICSGPGPVDMEAVAAQDRRLNLMFVKMSKNPVFEWIMRTIQISLGSYDSVLYEDEFYRGKTVSNWYNTALEIANGEPLRALSFIGYHYVLLLRCLEERGEVGPDRLIPIR